MSNIELASADGLLSPKNGPYSASKIAYNAFVFVVRCSASVKGKAV
jgi:hypothetical protein